MKFSKKKYLTTLLILIATQSAFSQIMYKSRYKSAIFIEGFGLSPIMSANYEIAPLRFQKSYLSARGGIGFLPANLGNGSGVSFPVGVSYNVMLNNLKKGISRRLMNKCKSLPAKFDVEYFFEVGPGYSYSYYPSSKESHNNFNAIFALKTQFYLDIPPNIRVGYIKVSLTPSLIDGKPVLIERKEDSQVGSLNPKNTTFARIENFIKRRRFYGGIALGISI